MKLPAAHMRNADVSSVLSGMRHILHFAFTLSIPMRAKVTRFQTAQAISRYFVVASIVFFTRRFQPAVFAFSTVIGEAGQYGRLRAAILRNIFRDNFP